VRKTRFDFIRFYYSFVGVKIIEDCAVKEVLTEKLRAGQSDRVAGAVTSQGNIKCDVFVNCTGMVNIISLKIFIHHLEFLVGTRTWFSMYTEC
jgi:glycine/D-amino acid oxidase-like deaminating enzyme